MNTVEYYRNLRANRELKKLGLSERIVNALGSVGVTTYHQLLQVTVKELKNDVPNIANVSIKAILELVSSKGDKLIGQDEFFNKQNKQKRKPLTLEQIKNCYPDNAIFTEQDGWLRVSAQTLQDIARNVEAAHGIKE